MAHWVNARMRKAHELSAIPRAHMKAEDEGTKRPLTSEHAPTLTSTHVLCPYTYNNKQIVSKE